MKKRILIIYTGGTIGMVATDNGYSPNREQFHDYLSSMPELKAASMPEWDIIDMDPLLDSSNISVNEWNRIGKAISDRYDEYDGFVILHGTDTMAYTASILSFTLENNLKPVILTGSQIPLCEIRNDARSNLITSIFIAAEGRVHGVCLYFGGKLLQGNRSVKLSSSDMDAFESPNYPHLADVGVNIVYNDKLLGSDEPASEALDPNALPAEASSCFRLREILDERIGIIKIFPGIHFEVFEPILTPELKAIVVEAFGAGNIPNNGAGLKELIKKAKKHGTIITVCTQCTKGTVLLGTYEASSSLIEAGAVSAFDMTSEAAVAKLYYLFSCGYSVDKIKQLMEENLCGELTRY